jgi:hypothetical protein
MFDSDSVASGLYRGLPVLSRDNFNDWKIQVIAYLTGVADHARVISRRPGPSGTFLDPKRPTADDAVIEKWDASERQASFRPRWPSG